MTALIALVVGFGGVGLGALLTRRNERRSRAERLLTQALNDAAAAIAEARPVLAPTLKPTTPLRRLE